MLLKDNISFVVIALQNKMHNNKVIPLVNYCQRDYLIEIYAQINLCTENEIYKPSYINRKE